MVQVSPFLVLGLVGTLLSGCAGKAYVTTGPMFDVDNGPLDNSDIPWVIAAGRDVTDRCSIEVFHLSSVKGGWPLFVGGHDDVSVTALHPKCTVRF